MTSNEILTVVKSNLQIAVPTMDGYLMNLIELATAAIGREGITLTDSVEDSMYVAEYAAYLYRHRRENEVAMPRSLRYRLNNRLFSEKMQG